MTKEPAQFTFTGADGATTWSISAWSGDGTATFAARGSTRHLALEGALSASLALALDIADRGSAGEGSRATPIRGEGEDLGDLFADMLDELGDAVALHGLGIEAVVVDGLLRRDDGGLLAWGYALGPLDGEGGQPPRLTAPAEVTERAGEVAIRGSLRR